MTMLLTGNIHFENSITHYCLCWEYFQKVALEISIQLKKAVVCAGLHNTRTTTFHHFRIRLHSRKLDWKQAGAWNGSQCDCFSLFADTAPCTMNDLYNVCVCGCECCVVVYWISKFFTPCVIFGHSHFCEFCLVSLFPMLVLIDERRRCVASSSLTFAIQYNWPL